MPTTGLTANVQSNVWSPQVAEDGPLSVSGIGKQGRSVARPARTAGIIGGRHAIEPAGDGERTRRGKLRHTQAVPSRDMELVPRDFRDFGTAL
jgi:hypothetical protein